MMPDDAASIHFCRPSYSSAVVFWFLSFSVTFLQHFFGFCPCGLHFCTTLLVSLVAVYISAPLFWFLSLPFTFLHHSFGFSRCRLHFCTTLLVSVGCTRRANVSLFLCCWMMPDVAASMHFCRPSAPLFWFLSLPFTFLHHSFGFSRCRLHFCSTLLVSLVAVYISAPLFWFLSAAREGQMFHYF